MSKTFELKDDSVVVVIGSGAGGGTLSNELTQRGASVVCLEAGPRLTLSDIVNDNATMFGRLSWLDKRIGTGDLNAGLPLWVCKTVGGTTVLGRRIVAFPRPRVPHPHRLRRYPRRQSARLAGHAAGA
jgi:choline dehydrogenase-like flavoprotein